MSKELIKLIKNSGKLKVENGKKKFPPFLGRVRVGIKQYPSQPPLIRGGALAFTLAEVLITLGVIGVVASVTIPTLIQNYQKHVTVTKLKRFASVLRQANAMKNKDIIEGNFIDPDNTFEPYNGTDAEKIFNMHLKPYIKFTDIKVMNKGLFAFFSDGSVMYYQKTRNCGGPTACSYITYCTEYKYCKDIDEKESYDKALDTRHNFLFWIGGKTQNYSTRESQLYYCNKDRKFFYGCSAMIESDGWKIEKDYPW